jgi:Na+/H+ antiporter NhaD/arsenite permease-like protein
MFLPFGWRELVMIGCAVLAWKWTARGIHEANHFDFAPVKEVGWLFVGIFLTMLPAFEVLGMSASRLGLQTPGQWFWATGILSGLLDNAPTYLAFLAAAFGGRGLHLDTQMPEFVSQHGDLLRAISLGAVFFGAITYVGNGPNLMVKRIAEQRKVNSPSFLDYVWKYSLPILLPLFALISHFFFSR